MLILAPMQGLTEVLFRRTYQSVFPDVFDYAISPFVSLTHGNLKFADKKISDILPQNNSASIPVVPQILGHETAEFIDLANHLFDLGYKEVNWNMGCPMRRVAAKQRGSGILPYPDKIKHILECVIPNIKPALSVKLRLGYYSPDEIDLIIPILNDFPVRNITIHPRIGKQVYSGRPNLEKLDSIIGLFKHPVIYNGDIFTIEDYKRIRLRYPNIVGVMVGRGALYNPFLPSEIHIWQTNHHQGLQSEIAREKAKTFIIALMEEIIKMPVRQQAKVRKMKEYWCLLSKALPQSEEQKRRVLHAEDLDEIFALILEMAK